PPAHPKPDAPPPPASPPAATPEKAKRSTGSSLQEKRVLPTNDRPVCPPDAPAWLQDTIKPLLKVNLDLHYHRLLRAYLALEKSYNYASGEAALPKIAQRPKQVGKWIQYARDRKPDINNVMKYEREWWVWWGKLQPSWREKGEDGRPVEMSISACGNWSTLIAPGMNGMLSVVASLSWWGEAEEKAGTGVSEGWRAAVKDVIWVFNALMAPST
ncbi:hypothetical protein C8R43DRAFT_871984, partial [Mycena crocata]